MFSLSGGFYQVSPTPPRTGRQVAEGLSNALLVVMKNETHGGEVNWERCGRPLALELLRSGSVDGLDGACAVRIERAPWVTTLPTE